MPNHCEAFTTLRIFRDGGLASFALVPARACHPIAASLRREVAALIEPLSWVVNGFDQATPHAAAAILGAGYRAVVPGAVQGRQRVARGGRGTERARRACAKRMGADLCVWIRRRWTPPSLSATRPTARGRRSSSTPPDTQLPLALEAVGRAGRIVLFGMNARASAHVRQYDITRRRRSASSARTSGSRSSRGRSGFLEKRLLDPTTMITHVLPLEGGAGREPR